MKKILAIPVAAVLLATMTAAPVHAGDRGWATAGKILTGVLGVTILGNALANAHAYPAPAYAPPPRAYYPPEVVWVPGHYEVRYERRWVPGYWEVERFARRGHGDDDDFFDGDHGRRGRRVWVPGYHERVEMAVWIPGHWEERG